MTTATEIIKFDYTEVIDEDDDENDIESCIPVEAWNLDGDNEIFGHQFAVKYRDTSYCGVSWWRLHNFMNRNGIYDQLPSGSAINNSEHTRYKDSEGFTVLHILFNTLSGEI